MNLINDILIFLIILLTSVLMFSMTVGAQEGRSVYVSKCTQCHNINPTKNGSIGPDVAGSSLELITLKTQKKKYPKGYKPKRKTKAMPIIKLTDSEILKISEYLNSFISIKKEITHER